MIAQVLPHARELVDYGHPDTLELRSRTDPREEEHVRGANGPTAQHNLLSFHRKALAAAFDLYPNGAFAVKQETPHRDVTLDGEVEPVARRVKIRDSHADAY